MGVTVRRCESLADVEAIEETLPSGPSQFHRRRHESDDGSVYLLAWVDGVAVGHVLVMPQSKYADVRALFGLFPEVNGLDVATAHRRRGVATALMRAAVAEARGMGGALLGLACAADNRVAIQLYEALGFESLGVDVVDEWAWLDELGQEHRESDPATYWTLTIASSSATWHG